MAAKGSYDIQAMRSSANKIEDYVKNYEQQKNKMVELVNSTTRFNDDPVVRDYLQKFENLKSDMNSVQNLMKAYASYLSEAAKTIEKATSVK